LFFRDYHGHLIDAVKRSLRDSSSLAVLMSPDRDQTMSQFIERIEAMQTPSKPEEPGPQQLMMEEKGCQGAQKAGSEGQADRRTVLKCRRQEAGEIACVAEVVKEARNNKLYDENKHRLYVLTLVKEEESG
jgi:hypothetical protein